LLSFTDVAAYAFALAAHVPPGQRVAILLSSAVNLAGVYASAARFKEAWLVKMK